MNNSEKENQQKLLDVFGELLIKNVRDRALYSAMKTARFETINPVKARQYIVLSELSSEQKEIICDLLSETITDTIYRFLELFEEQADKLKLAFKQGGREYDIIEISEKMGSEIARFDDTGWIQRFSAIGRFVL